MSVRLRWFALTLLLVAAGSWWLSRDGGGTDRTVVLLLSDEADLDHPVVTAWIEAARVEGVPLTPMRASAFLRPTHPFHTARYAGLILPDIVHRIAGDALLQRLREYVEAGGKLMVVYDAATLTLQERSYSKTRSRLSELIGVDYALYDQLRDHTIARADVMPAALGVRGLLRLPPDELGERRALHNDDGLNLYYSLNLGQWMLNRGSEPRGSARYPYFVTRGDYAGQRLLSGDDGQLFAGLRRVGKGSVAFVNLNLGWLKALSNGALLHGFLHWFAVEVCGLPAPAAESGGLGGPGPVFTTSPASSGGLKIADIFGQWPRSARVSLVRGGPRSETFDP